MTPEFTCELDGFVMQADTEEELLGHVERHIAEAHAHLVETLSRDDIAAMVRAHTGSE